VVAIGSLSIDMALPSLPATAQALGTQPATVQLTVTLFLAGFALAQLIHGPLSDRIGRRRVLQALGAGSGPVIGRAVIRDPALGALDLRG
jgi:DHA1 family bicyclomycin/chloramphenicol resistance-like MFS transporter